MSNGQLFTTYRGILNGNLNFNGGLKSIEILYEHETIYEIVVQLMTEQRNISMYSYNLWVNDIINFSCPLVSTRERENCHRVSDLQLLCLIQFDSFVALLSFYKRTGVDDSFEVIINNERNTFFCSIWVWQLSITADTTPTKQEVFTRIEYKNPGELFAGAIYRNCFFFSPITKLSVFSLL